MGSCQKPANITINCQQPRKPTITSWNPWNIRKRTPTSFGHSSMEEEEQVKNVVFVQEPKKSNKKNVIPIPSSNESSINTKSASGVQVHRQQHHHEVHGVPHPHEGPPRVT